MAKKKLSYRLRNWFEPKKEIYDVQERALLWIKSIEIARTRTQNVYTWVWVCVLNQNFWSNWKWYEERTADRPNERKHMHGPSLRLKLWIKHSFGTNWVQWQRYY